jgi:hypothetical protein
MNILYLLVGAHGIASVCAMSGIAYLLYLGGKKNFSIFRSLMLLLSCFIPILNLYWLYCLPTSIKEVRWFTEREKI